MKGSPRLFFLLFYTTVLISGSIRTWGQQSNTLFFMHSLPEANYINPAVQIDCGTFVGLPLVSSFHMNFANSGFPMGKLITLYTDNTFTRKSDMKTDGMPHRNYMLTEFHSVLFAIGTKRNDYYYSFTITEKNNAELIYTPDLVSFFLRGSTDFEGQKLQLDGIRFSLDHLREYAFGVSKKITTGLTLGFKFKVLFGKFNISSGNSSIGVTVEPTTQNLLFDLNCGYNSSLPSGLHQTGPDLYTYDEIYPGSWLSRLLNRNNPGLALDLGFIYKYSDDWTFSGSLLDMGLLWYRSNLNNYSVQGTYLYTGPFGQNELNGEYFWPMFNEWNANMDETLTAQDYIYFLRPRLYLGGSRKLNKSYDVNFLIYNRFLPHKIQTGATVSVLTRADKALRASISWSYMNNSPLNLGLGFSYGRRPVQLYFVTDNLIGFIVPLSVKNINARFGINLNLGCKSNFNIDDCGCSWMRGENQRRLRKQELRKK